MANTRALSVQFSDTESPTSEYVTAPAAGAAPSEQDTATSSSPAFFSARSTVEEQIERSKRHWSELAECDSVVDVEDEEAVAADNVQVFKSLQQNSEWGFFFRTFGDGEDDVGELVMGERFAKGGQAEIFHAQIKWRNPRANERALKQKIKWVLKVFPKGTLLRYLQLQWPQGFLQNKAKEHHLIRDDQNRFNELRRFYCDVHLGTLLKDGRFAFLMRREYEDLRSLIDRQMLRSKNGRPFSKADEEWIMYDIALGMIQLHSYNIVHRDLKASNVLMGCIKGKELLMQARPGFGYCSKEIANELSASVADFECSMGVIGTGFFRAPEILKACIDGNASQRHELYTQAAAVYSYGMTYYEVLTGKLPFEGHLFRNCVDLILGGQRPELHEDVDDWVRELLSRCWQSNPEARPTFKEILNIFEANSEMAESFRIALPQAMITWNRFLDETKP